VSEGLKVSRAVHSTLGCTAFFKYKQLRRVPYDLEVFLCAALTHLDIHSMAKEALLGHTKVACAGLRFPHDDPSWNSDDAPFLASLLDSVFPKTD